VKKFLSIIAFLTLFSGDCFSQVYRPTQWASVWNSTIQNAAQGRAYLGIVAGLTNYGGTVTNFVMYGTTLQGSTTNASLTASRVMVTDANKVQSSSAVTTTTLAFLDATSSVQTQLDSKAGLAATNVWTGTNTFTATGLFPANNIGLRLLWSSPTNIYLATVVTNVNVNYTNNGDFSLGTYVASGTIPPLLGSNSTLALSVVILRTNANTSAMLCNFFIGSNTNWVGNHSLSATSLGLNASVLVCELQNANSMTQQVTGGSAAFAAPQIVSATNFFNSAISNTFYFSA
jgi:hypothetical protein